VDKSVDDLWVDLGKTTMIWGQPVDAVWTTVRTISEGRIKLVEKLWRTGGQSWGKPGGSGDSRWTTDAVDRACG
jgi:hypothetical protein